MIGRYYSDRQWSNSVDETDDEKQVTFWEKVNRAISPHDLFSSFGLHHMVLLSRWGFSHFVSQVLDEKSFKGSEKNYV